MIGLFTVRRGKWGMGKRDGEMYSGGGKPRREMHPTRRGESWCLHWTRAPLKRFSHVLTTWLRHLWYFMLSERVVWCLIHGPQSLRDSVMSRLLTTPVENVEWSRYLREVSEKENYNSGVIVKLTSQLETVEQLRDDDVSRALLTSFDIKRVL